MDIITKRIRGMQDLLPAQSEKWEMVEKIVRDEFYLYGFKSIRTPVLEHTELFERGVGDSSDIVEKEMYTFKDKGDRSVTLRPEGTAGTLRAVLENGMHSGVLPLKLMYLSSCYRYEKPQSGRYREFFQFGLEVFGAPSAMAEAELICGLKSVFERLRLKNISLQINSIGCQVCRKNYNQAVKEYFLKHESHLCQTCQSRISRNPLRILDCKSKVCSEIAKNAPIILDYLCDECSEHMGTLKSYLDAGNIAYEVNPKIVRGLDYYSKTVFEFVCKLDDSDLTICGGGRYDALSEILGGPSLAAIGAGIGMERLIMIMEKQNVDFPQKPLTEVYIAPIGEKAKFKALNLCQMLRKSSIFSQMDIVGKNLKPQMKYADKIGAKYSLVIGDSELETNKANIKNMKTGEKFEISLGDNFINEFLSIELKNSFE